jgi:hypothetical protein
MTSTSYLHNNKNENNNVLYSTNNGNNDADNFKKPQYNYGFTATPPIPNVSNTS